MRGSKPLLRRGGAGSRSCNRGERSGYQNRSAVDGIGSQSKSGDHGRNPLGEFPATSLNAHLRALDCSERLCNSADSQCVSPRHRRRMTEIAPRRLGCENIDARRYSSATGAWRRCRSGLGPLERGRATQDQWRIFCVHIRMDRPRRDYRWRPRPRHRGAEPSRTADATVGFRRL